MRQSVPGNFHSSSGFTLIELLVVIAIIATLGVVTFAFYTQMTPKYRLQSTADSLSGFITNTRTSSIASTGGGSWYVTYDHATRTFTQGCLNCPSSPGIIKSVHIPETLTVDSTPSLGTAHFQRVTGQLMYPNETTQLTVPITLTLHDAKRKIVLTIPPTAPVSLSPITAYP